MNPSLKKILFGLVTLAATHGAYPISEKSLSESEESEIKELEIIIQQLQARLSSLKEKKLLPHSSSSFAPLSDTPSKQDKADQGLLPPSQNTEADGAKESLIKSSPPESIKESDVDKQPSEESVTSEPSSPVASTFDSFQPATEEQWSQGPMPKKPLSSFQRQEPSPSSDDPYTMGRTSLKEGRISQARSFLSQVSPKSQNYAHALYWLGTIAMLQDKDYDKATTLLGKAYDACKDKEDNQKLSASILMKMAECLYHQNKIPAARVVLKECKKKAIQLKDKQLLQDIKEWSKKMGQ
jgi:TolA-binding protein